MKGVINDAFSLPSTGSTWSYRPSRTCWSTWSCCKCSDHSVPHLLYLIGQRCSWLLYLPRVTSSGCRWWAWSQRSAGSVWPEGRWRIKGIPRTSRPSWATGVDYKDNIWSQMALSSYNKPNDETLCSLFRACLVHLVRKVKLEMLVKWWADDMLIQYAHVCLIT